MKRLILTFLMLAFSSFAPAGELELGFSLPFAPKQIIDIQKKYPPYELKRHTVRYEAEGAPYVEQHIRVERGGKLMLDLYVEPVTANADKAKWLVREVKIISPEFRDSAGMHVGAKVSDFFAVYPQASVYYIPEADVMSMENGKDDRIQYGVSTKSYRMRINVDSDMIRLKKSGFKEDARITDIRLY